MKCPHCLDSIFPPWQYQNVQVDVSSSAVNGVWRISSFVCPGCGKLSVYLGIGHHNDPSVFIEPRRLVHPKGSSRDPISSDVPVSFGSDYAEAVAVFSDSPKASAALSRRCLQHLLREKAGVKKADLSKEIDQVIASGQLPSHLAEAIDAVRNVGNFAAHPMKSTNTGEILDVEPGEAEWLLDTLEGLFDFYFVQPAILKKKRDTLNAKLAQAGKPPMK